jgi:hypothetical protein
VARYRLGRAVSQKVFHLFDHDKAMLGLIDLFPTDLRAVRDKAGGIAAE